MTTTRAGVLLVAVSALLAIDVAPAAAQLGALVSPGRLSKAHASLEGVTNCLSCHAAGQQVAAAKCLSCHKPIAERIAQKKGVHRAVTADCVTCHVEHAGVAAIDLFSRPRRGNFWVLGVERRSRLRGSLAVTVGQSPGATGGRLLF